MQEERFGSSPGKWCSMNLIQPGEQLVIIGRAMSFRPSTRAAFRRESSSFPSSTIVRSAVKSVSRMRSNPSILMAATICPVFLPVGRPRASAMPTRTAGAVWATTNFSGSSRAAQTSPISDFS